MCMCVGGCVYEVYSKIIDSETVFAKTDIDNK